MNLTFHTLFYEASITLLPKPHEYIIKYKYRYKIIQQPIRKSHLIIVKLIIHHNQRIHFRLGDYSGLSLKYQLDLE